MEYIPSNPRSILYILHLLIYGAIQFIADDVKARISPPPPMGPPLSRHANPILPRGHRHRQSVRPSVHADGVLRQRCEPVPDERAFRRRRGGAMGQRRRLRAAVPVAVHQRPRAADVRAGSDYPGSGRGPGPNIGFSALERGD